MVTFGFSAFLKLLSMNERPQKTELRRRAGPSTSGGYDFHSSFRRHARQFLLNGIPMAEVIASADNIIKVPERLSAISALKRLAQWREKTPGTIFRCEPVVFESPNKLFRVKFEPDFGQMFQGTRTAFHLWNTKHPSLARGPTYAALALAREAYLGHADAPDDVGVLSVREQTSVYLLGTMPVPSATMSSIVDQIEEAIRRGSSIPPASPDDRPTPP